MASLCHVSQPAVDVYVDIAPPLNSQCIMVVEQVMETACILTLRPLFKPFNN